MDLLFKCAPQNTKAEWRGEKIEVSISQGKIADYLISHGVTVQEWISVKDRLPEFTEEEMKRYRFFGDTFFPEFNVMILGATQATTLYFNGGSWYDEECRCYCVTHWQPMPQPPRGA